MDLGAVEGVTGWHISSVRRALAPRIAHRVPSMYTALYEGGEDTAWVFLTSETPRDQLRPAMELPARTGRAALVRGGQPLRVAAAHGPLGPPLRPDSGGRVAGEVYLPLGTEDFEPALRHVERADAVLMLLVGSDAVRFNRAFAARGLPTRCLRLSTLMDENMLVASGPAAAEDLYSTAGSSPRWPRAARSTSTGSMPPASGSRLPPWAASASPATRVCCCRPRCWDGPGHWTSR
ncbi:ABC transporter substrate-binding protein [Streptomyces sp. NPDC047880]|uniref:ABC transporter substrate-binding protein n=1 Tax=Streptomyces sp. NPDC047880 TaxID=3155626 RepID=UPI003456A58F